MKIKIGPAKQSTPIHKPSEFSSLNASMIKISKHTSKHTKSSTSHTLQSLHIAGLSTKQNTKNQKTLLTSKNKKLSKNKEKESSSSTEVKKSKGKSKQKKQSNFEMKNYNQTKQNLGAVSYREYCLVENSFLPITSNFQYEKLEQILKSTANSTPFYEDFNRSTARKIFPFKLKQKINSIFDSKISERECQAVEASSKRPIGIQACPFYSEIGIQYSQRFEINVLKTTPTQESSSTQVEPEEQAKQTQSVKQVVNMDIQTEEVEEKDPMSVSRIQMFPVKAPEEQTLSDILLKLEFKFLPNQRDFDDLSKMEKEHYSGLLSELISKLTVSPRQSTNANKIKSRNKIEMEQVHFVPLEQMKVKYEKIQKLAYVRECQQMNWIQRPFNPADADQSIDTSLIAVSTFLFNFFCYLEINYSEHFMEMMKREYGLPYRTQYYRLTRNQKLAFRQIRVLDEFLFEQFCSSTLNQVSYYEKIHLKAVFDNCNNILDTYRSYYNHSGEPFPWAVKMYHNICEYAFDEDSLQIIFEQTKETIERDLSHLCGILINQEQFKGPNECELLQMKRNEKENKLIQSWLLESNTKNREIQNYATKVFFDISELIYEELLLEIFKEKPFHPESKDFQFIE